MLVGFTTTYAISAHHHWFCEFESRNIVESDVKYHQTNKQTSIQSPKYIFVFAFFPPQNKEGQFNEVNFLYQTTPIFCSLSFIEYIMNEDMQCLNWLPFPNNSIQHYVTKFVSDLRRVGGFLRVLRFPTRIQLTATILLIYCWKWR